MISWEVYWHQLDKLNDALQQKRSELINRKDIVFHQDNARPLTSLVTHQKLLQLECSDSQSGLYRTPGVYDNLQGVHAVAAVSGIGIGPWLALSRDGRMSDTSHQKILPKSLALLSRRLFEAISFHMLRKGLCSANNPNLNDNDVDNEINNQHNRDFNSVYDNSAKYRPISNLSSDPEKRSTVARDRSGGDCSGALPREFHRTSAYLHAWINNRRLMKHSPFSYARTLNLPSSDVEPPSLSFTGAGLELDGIHFHDQLLTSVTKSSEIPALVNQLALETINGIPQSSLKIYTDGSRVFRSELIAIRRGLQCAAQLEDRFHEIWILTDSRASIQHLANWGDIGDQTSQDILSLLHDLS
ncbi:RNase H domain-containing protein [Trichonephila clavipes]|uniref:RNase H domain-containing protein n=1 Tax=Trichonephila clavipes TaxID=2585209 RepID=A0A8X6VJL3_TRICX|nr:RNase H domain-containing protein [Trichonephila clavipes]